MPFRPSLRGPAARRIERLLGLRPYSLLAVERRANGDYGLRFRSQRVGDRSLYALRLSRKRVQGYGQVSATARPQGVAYRRRRNALAFSRWLWWRVDPDAPAASAWMTGDPGPVDELRAAILELATPDLVVVVIAFRPASVNGRAA